MATEKIFRTIKRPWVIAVITFILVFVIVILGGQSYRDTERATVREFNRRQLVMAREATRGIEMYFETIAGTMRALGRLHGVQRLDESVTRHEIKHIFDELKRLGVNDTGVLDANGVLRYNVGAPGLEGNDFSWRRYFREAQKMTSVDAYIIQFITFKGVEAGHKGIIVAIPMFETHVNRDYSHSSTKFAGVIVCTIRLDTLIQKFVAPVTSSMRGHTYMIDEEHNILWSPDRSLFGKDLLNEARDFSSFQTVLENMSAGNSGAEEYTFYRFDETAGKFTKEKEENLIAYEPLHLGKEVWSLGVWAPREDVRGLIHSGYVKHLMMEGLIIIIIIAGSSFILAISFRYSKTLKKEVESRTGEFMESHQRLLTVLDSLDAVVYVADMETYEILFVDKYLRNIFGNVVGKSCWQALQAGQDGPCDFCTNDKLLTPDGKPAGVHVWEFQNTITGRWYEIHDRAITWVDGRIVRLEIATDITKRKQAEEELLKSEEKYRTLIENSFDCICHIDLDGKFVYMNPGGIKQNEFKSFEDIRGLDCTEAIKEEYKGLMMDGLERAKKGESINLEYASITAGEKEKWWESTIGSVRDDKSNVSSLVRISRDITERKRVEQQAARQFRRLKKLSELSMTLAGDPVDVFSRIARMIGELFDTQVVCLSEVRGDELYFLSVCVDGEVMIDAGHCPLNITPCATVQESKDMLFYDHVAERFPEASFLKEHNAFSYCGFPSLDSSSNVVSVTCLLDDKPHDFSEEDRDLLRIFAQRIGMEMERQRHLAERKKLEDQLLQSQKMEAVGNLAGGLAHDFNNMLTAITCCADFLELKIPEKDPSRGYVNQILSSAEKAANLTQGLLAFSRKQILQPKPVNINDIVKNVEKLLSRLIGEDIEFNTILFGKEPVLMIDSGQIEQVLMNLVTNARDAMPDGGTLTIKTDVETFDDEYMKTHGYGEPGKYALVSVSDTGMGMDEETRDKIFEPFFTTKMPGKGTGLGLAMVYGIIKQHKGYINVYSEPGEGTTFRIYLPVTESEVEKEKAQPTEYPAGGSETIILAEDEADVREITRQVLEEFGYTVIEAVDGVDAVNKFREYEDRVKLLIIDVVMPKKTGKEVYDEIREIKPDIDILFTSGYNVENIHKKGVIHEGFNFIQKPMSIKDLLGKVREILDEGTT